MSQLTALGLFCAGNRLAAFPMQQVIAAAHGRAAQEGCVYDQAKSGIADSTSLLQAVRITTNSAV